MGWWWTHEINDLTLKKNGKSKDIAKLLGTYTVFICISRHLDGLEGGVTKNCLIR
jgi:hypothetical protein